MSRKFWHMLVNLCFHISLTCGVFVGGINQTRYASVCQAVSIRRPPPLLQTLTVFGRFQRFFQGGKL